MANIILVSPTNEQGSLLRRGLLISDPKYRVRLVPSVDRIIGRISNQAIHLIIYHVEMFGDSSIQNLRELRDVGYTCNILVLAEAADSEARLAMADFNGMVLMENFSEGEGLVQMVAKLLESRGDVHQRIFRRYNTVQKVTYEYYGKPGSGEMTLFNLSRGGAYMECEVKSERVEVGDLLRMDIELDQIDRTHRMHAKVVWTTPKGPVKGGYGIGVAFMKPDEVYRHLLDRM